MRTKQSTQLRPTVFIALGGTGAHIAARLRLKMVEVYGEVPGLFDMLLIDTARPPVVGREIPEEDFIQVRTNSLADYIDNLEGHPNIKEWLPDPQVWSNIRRDDLHDGAQKVRALGRLSLFVHQNAEKLYARLRETINGVTGLSLSTQLIRRGIQAAHGIPPQVYLLSSTVGGTGSGILLDVAYMIRREFGEKGAFITMVLLLPGIFGSSELLEANTCASLQELDHHMREGNFHANYPGLDVDVAPATKPFDVCYLVDNGNEQHVTLNTEENAHSMIAEALFAISASRRAGDFHQYFVDGAVGAVRGRHARNQAGADRECFYSSLGAHALRFPRKEVVDICATRHASEMLRLLSRAPDLADKAVQDQISAEVMDFINRNRLNEFPHDQIIDSLRQKPLGELANLYQAENRRIVHFKESALPQGMTEVWQKLEGSLTSRWIPAMTKQAASMLKPVSEDLRKAAIIRVNRVGEHGPAHAQEFLRSLRDLAEGWSTHLREEANEANARAERDAEEFRKTKSRLSGLLNPSLKQRIVEWIMGDEERPQQVQTLRDKMLGASLGYHRARIEAEAVAQAGNLLGNLSGAAAEIAEEIQQIGELLNTAASTANSRVNELTATRTSQPNVDREGNPAITSVVSYADVDRIYTSLTQAEKAKDHYDLLLADMAQFLTGRSVYELRASGDPDLYAALLDWATGKFDALIHEQYTLEGFLKTHKASEESAIISDLKSNAAPFCALSPGHAEGMLNPKQTNIFATASQASTLFADQFHQDEYGVRVATLDSFEMSAVHTLHAFPLFVMDESGIYAQSLVTLRTQKENPGFRVKDEISSQFAGIDPLAGGAISETRDVADLLDLGLLMNLMQIKGPAYGYHPADSGKRIPLTYTGKQGRPAACAFLGGTAEQNSVVRSSLEKDLLDAIAELTSTSDKSYRWLRTVWVPFRRDRLTRRKNDPLRREDWEEYNPALIDAVAKRANLQLRDLYA